MRALTILPLLLACVNIAFSGVVGGGISTELTPPEHTGYSTGYGSVASGIHLSSQSSHGLSENLLTTSGSIASLASKGLHLPSTSYGIPNGLNLGSLSNHAGLFTSGAALHQLALGQNTGILLNTGGIGLSGNSFSSGNVVDAGTTYSQNLQRVPIAFPHPVPVIVNRPVPVPVSVPHPVEVPRPVQVEVPHPVKVYIPKPVPVEIPRPVPVPVQHPVYVKVPHPIPVSVPQPYPVVIQKPVPVSVPHKIEVPVEISHSKYVIEKPVTLSVPHKFEVSVPVGIAHSKYVVPGGLKGGLSNVLHGGFTSGYGSYAQDHHDSYINSHYKYSGHSQAYDSNGGYKY